MSTYRKHPKRTHPKKPLSKEQIALVTKQNLILVISILMGFLFLLFFKIGGFFWPIWLSDYRKSLIGLVLFVTIYLGVLSPLMIEANSNPRPLSGPGRDPRFGRHGRDQ
jgi:vacuolar-type H+-ATPase subunit I/STV1